MDASIARPTQIRIEARVSDADSDTASLRRRAEQVQRGGARAAVLGVNDGLVTNLCLIWASLVPARPHRRYAWRDSPA